MASTRNAARSGHRAARRGGPVLAVLCVSLLIVSLDNTILNVALPTIVRTMHASSSELQWIVDAYAVVFAGLLLVAGSLGDRLGRKWVFMVGLLVFAAGSAVSAFSSTPDHLIAARAFMGIGAAAIMPSTLSILTNVFTETESRARAIGFWSGTTGLGVAIGPVAGGWLLAHYWWGSVFLINVPIALLGFLAAAWLVPNSKNPVSKRPDPVGAGLSILGMGLLLWGIIEAPSRTWTSLVVVGSIAAAVVVITAFIAWERRSTHAMLELSFFASRQFSVAMGAMGLVIFALMGGLFVLTQYLQFSLGYSPLQTGVRVAPIAAVLLVVAPLSTVLVRWAGRKLVVFTGMGLIALGLALLSQVTMRSTYTDVLPAFLLMGIGTGLAFAPCTESVMGSLPLDRAGVGSATNSAASSDRWCARRWGPRQPARHPLSESDRSGTRPLPDSKNDLGSHHGVLGRCSRYRTARRRSSGSRAFGLCATGVRERHGPGGHCRGAGRRRRRARRPRPFAQPAGVSRTTGSRRPGAKAGWGCADGARSSEQPVVSIEQRGDSRRLRTHRDAREPPHRSLCREPGPPVPGWPGRSDMRSSKPARGCGPPLSRNSSPSWRVFAVTLRNVRSWKRWCS